MLRPRLYALKIINCTYYKNVDIDAIDARLFCVSVITRFSVDKQLYSVLLLRGIYLNLIRELA